MTRRLVIVVAVVAALAGLLAYLRDPPWLLGLDSGFTRWERDAVGAEFRWIAGHASFFVPSDATDIVIPMQGPGSSGAPATVSISIDDRPADRLTLRDEIWHESRLRPTSGTTRRVRRIDIRVDRMLPGNRGIRIGVVRFSDR